MSVQLRRGESVSLTALARGSQDRKSVAPVMSNVERVVKLNDLTALHTLIRVKGVR